MANYLKTIHEALDAGLTLELAEFRGTRRFTCGQIARTRMRNKRVRITHLSRNMRPMSIGPGAVRELAQQAKAKLAKKDEILRAEEAQRRRSLDID